MYLFICFFIAHAWLLDHLTPSLPVLTDDVVSWVFIEFSALEKVVTIHSDMDSVWAGFVSIQAKPVEVYSHKSHVRWLGESGKQPLLSPGTLGLDLQWSIPSLLVFWVTIV
ncbi:uncharacterized protein TNCV_3434711 [Trichonephila clavipes]|nr:uncharacterized protein TNCV_3434711 [Trichonephila clavipes]